MRKASSRNPRIAPQISAIISTNDGVIDTAEVLPTWVMPSPIKKPKRAPIRILIPPVLGVGLTWDERSFGKSKKPRRSATVFVIGTMTALSAQLNAQMKIRDTIRSYQLNIVGALINAWVVRYPVNAISWIGTS